MVLSDILLQNQRGRGVLPLIMLLKLNHNSWGHETEAEHAVTVFPCNPLQRILGSLFVGQFLYSTYRLKYFPVWGKSPEPVRGSACVC